MIFLKKIKKNNIFKILSVIIFTIIFVNLLSFSSKNKSKTDAEKLLITNDFVRPVYIPQDLEFAGEKVPIEFFDVKESLDRELLVNTYWHSRTILWIKKASRYFPIIEPILEKQNVPNDFKYLAVAESGLTNATSSAGARGFWQFMKGTATSYNLEISTEIDERYNLVKSTVAACKLLKNLKKQTGTWANAASAYNMGLGNFNKNAKQQNTNDYYEMLLNSETARYVYRIIAIKLIYEQQKNYHLNIDESFLYKPIETELIEIDSTIPNFTKFAEKHDISYKMLKFFNPWLRKNKLTNKNRNTYYIRIPEEKFRTNSTF